MQLQAKGVSFSPREGRGGGGGRGIFSIKWVCLTYVPYKFMCIVQLKSEVPAQERLLGGGGGGGGGGAHIAPSWRGHEG